GAGRHLLERGADLVLGERRPAGNLLDQLAQFLGGLEVHGLAQAAWGGAGALRRRGAMPAISRKLASSAWPCSEAMLSGWNCTPCTGCVLCCRPMTRPPSVGEVSAVTARLSGRVARSTMRE